MLKFVLLFLAISVCVDGFFLVNNVFSGNSVEKSSFKRPNSVKTYNGISSAGAPYSKQLKLYITEKRKFDSQNSSFKKLISTEAPIIPVTSANEIRNKHVDANGGNRLKRAPQRNKDSQSQTNNNNDTNSNNNTTNPTIDPEQIVHFVGIAGHFDSLLSTHIKDSFTRISHILNQPWHQ